MPYISKKKIEEFKSAMESYISSYQKWHMESAMKLQKEKEKGASIINPSVSYITYTHESAHDRGTERGLCLARDEFNRLFS